MFTDIPKWAEIRRRVLTGEISKRAACAEYEIHWDTLQKTLTHTEPPGYRRTQPRKSKLESYLPIIHEILQSDRQVHRKQRHTIKRIFERLRDEHGYAVGITIVSDAVRAWKQQTREVFLPLSHPPGEAPPHETLKRHGEFAEGIRDQTFVRRKPHSDEASLKIAMFLLRRAARRRGLQERTPTNTTPSAAAWPRPSRTAARQRRPSSSTKTNIS